MNIESLVILVVFSTHCLCLKLPLEVFQHHPAEHFVHHHRLNHNNGNFHRRKIVDLSTVKILYQIGTSDADLPDCEPRAVCNKLDMYDSPWIEKQCRCKGARTCPLELQPDDGFTFSDKTRQYKLCEPVKKIPKCRYFRDTTWTITLFANNLTEQIINCHCPKNSMTYLTKRQAVHLSDTEVAFQYQFACSPQATLRCQRKEPCRLFTVRKRQEFLDEVNVNSLCQCPHAHRCPHHHMDYGVIAGKSYTEEAIKTYSGYCLPS